MDKDKALKLALDALINHEGNYELEKAGAARSRKAIAAIKQVLAAQQEHEPENEPDVSLASVQEPVAKYIGECSEGSLVQLYEDVKKGTNFYTTPPAQRQWVGLTDEEVNKIVEAHTTDDHGYDIWCDGRSAARSIEAKLKEKNT